jgi:hypothetical protein
MATTTRPVDSISRLQLFHEEVVPRIKNAASVCWDLAFTATDTDEKTRLYNKTHALNEIVREHEHRLTAPQTNLDDTLQLIAFVQESSRLSRLDESGIRLAVSYMLELT